MVGYIALNVFDKEKSYAFVSGSNRERAEADS